MQETRYRDESVEVTVPEDVAQETAVRCFAGDFQHDFVSGRGR